MALDSDLMGAGMPAELALQIGETISNLTAAGTTQTTGLALTPLQTGITLATAGGADSATLSISTPRWRPIFVSVQTATTANIFPPSGHTINAAAQDAAVTIAQNLARIFIRTNSNHWVSFLAA